MFRFKAELGGQIAIFFQLELLPLEGALDGVLPRDILGHGIIKLLLIWQDLGLMLHMGQRINREQSLINIPLIRHTFCKIEKNPRNGKFTCTDSGKEKGATT